MAANSQGIRAGRAFVELYTKSDLLERGLAGGLSTLKSWAGKAAKIASGLAVGGLAAAGTAIVGAISHFTTHGDEIKKASDRLGIGAETLSALGYAAEQSGSDLAGLEKGLRKLQQNILEAAEDGGEAAESFRLLGLEATDLLAMKPEDQWLAVADSLSKVQNVTERNARAMKAFGKGGTELIPLLMGGSKGVSALMEEASRVGAVVTQEQAASAEKVGDAFARVWGSIKGLFFQVGALIVPITEQIETISFFAVDVVKSSADWLKGTLAIDGAMEGLTDAWEAFSDAVAAGDVELAMKIAAKTIEHEWSQMYDRLRDKGKKWQSQAQTDIAKFLADQMAGTSESQLQKWAASHGLDPIGPIENLFRGKTDPKEMKAMLDQMQSEADAAGVVSREEAERRKAEEAKFKSEMEKLREEAKNSKDAAEVAKAFAKEEARIKKGAAALNAGVVGLGPVGAKMDARQWLSGQPSAVWGSFTGSSGNLRNPARAFEAESLKEQKEAKKVLEEIRDNTAKNKPLVLG